MDQYATIEFFRFQTCLAWRLKTVKCQRRPELQASIKIYFVFASGVCREWQSCYSWGKKKKKISAHFCPASARTMKAILYWLQTNSSRAWMIARLWLFALHHSVTHHVLYVQLHRAKEETPSCFKASPRTQPFSQSSVHYQGINVLHVFSSSFFFS